MKNIFYNVKGVILNKLLIPCIHEISVYLKEPKLNKNIELLNINEIYLKK